MPNFSDTNLSQIIEEENRKKRIGLGLPENLPIQNSSKVPISNFSVQTIPAQTTGGTVPKAIYDYLSNKFQTPEKEWSGGVNKVPKSKEEPKKETPIQTNTKQKPIEEMASGLVQASPIEEQEKDYSDNDTLRKIMAVLGGGMSTYGAALRGGDTSGINRNTQDLIKLIDFQKQERIESDPDSKESKLAREYAQTLFPDQKIDPNLSAGHIKKMSPYINQRFEAWKDQQELALRQQAIDRSKLMRDGQSGVKPDKKANSQIEELNLYKDLLNNDLDELKKVYKEHGNNSFSGAVQDRIKQLKFNIANNVTKMRSPTSAVTTDEIKAVDSILGSGGWLTRDKTSIDSVDSLKSVLSKEIDTRLKYANKTDQDAIEFVQKNPNDPRAKIIKQELDRKGYRY